MANFIILTPTFNDWKSLNKLLSEINKNVSKIKGNFTIVIIDDASTVKSSIKIKKVKKIKKIIVIKNKKNLGSQKSICIGLKYLKKIKTKSIVVVMDSDGEDDPKKIKQLIDLAIKNPSSIITANRLRREGNIIFNFFYKLHLLVTFILTGKYINFGNYSSFHSKNLIKNFPESDLLLAYSAAISKNFSSIKSKYISKKKRYYEKSKVNILFLIKHSINIISVFKFNVIKSSSILGVLLMLVYFITNNSLFYLILLFIIFFNIIIIFNSKNINASKNCLNLIDSIKKYKN